MKKVADVLTSGGIAGCSSADFAFANTAVPQPPPHPTDLGFPLTDRQLQRTWRNPPIQPSTLGNKSPSLASSDSEIGIDEVQSQQCVTTLNCYQPNEIGVDGLFTDFTGSLHNYQEWTSPLSETSKSPRQLLSQIASLVLPYEKA
ncbi:hypothetical protein DY000_02062482 [Brassica cretica]|uniref:Uncharacterized protein n=1 Tax=Brassica cretica TaxID=69181 RepID=A0ABQ7AMH4_BRACR|nr:hypothetical protein DY000_02062482 [Brassica cretica]